MLTAIRDSTVSNCNNFISLSWLTVLARTCNILLTAMVSLLLHTPNLGLPWWFRGWSICLQCRRPGFSLWLRKISWRKEWQPTLVNIPHQIGMFTLGIVILWVWPVYLPLGLLTVQYSCLKNPMDRGAWRATVLHGVIKSQTWPND